MEFSQRINLRCTSSLFGGTSAVSTHSHVHPLVRTDQGICAYFISPTHWSADQKQVCATMRAVHLDTLVLRLSQRRATCASRVLAVQHRAAGRFACVGAVALSKNVFLTRSRPYPRFDERERAQAALRSASKSKWSFE